MGQAESYGSEDWTEQQSMALNSSELPVMHASNGVIQKQTDHDKDLQMLAESKLARIFFEKESSGLFLDPVQLKLIRELLISIKFLENRINELEKGAPVSEEEKAAYKNISSKNKLIFEEQTNYLTQSNITKNSERMEEVEQLINEKEILEKKNECLLKVIEIQLQNK